MRRYSAQSGEFFSRWMYLELLAELDRLEQVKARFAPDAPHVPDSRILEVRELLHTCPWRRQPDGA